MNDEAIEFSLHKADAVLVIGGGRGIGLGLVHQLTKRNPECVVWATYRDPERATELLDLQNQPSPRVRAIRCNPLEEAELEELALKIKDEHQHLDMVIVAPGILCPPGKRPEKSLRDIDVQQLQEVFTVNAVMAPLVAKHTRTLISRAQPAAFVALSAMVGSIEDNRRGGWYGYRASKAALNMMIKTMAIEFERSGYTIHVGAIHPGTTQTALSQNFLSGVQHKIWDPHSSANNILEVIENLENGETGFFKNWDGTTIPW